MTPELTIIGAGLAGSEAAWQAARRGVRVRLYEMRPHKMTPAHATDKPAELVCSNSLGSNLPDRAPGLLKDELRYLESLLVRCADAASVPAGGALAVDRGAFSGAVLDALESESLIDLIREEVAEIPDGPCIIATGPLTSEPLADQIAALTGQDSLYFYDALAPIVTADSIDMSVAYRANRYGRGETDEGDYINCPMDEVQYQAFVEALLAAERNPLRDFEQEDARFFEGCLPVEQIASRGERALAFGPMRPVGLTNPHTGKRPHAVVQLRQDNLAGTLYNLVGFQTNLRWPEQRRVFGMIPGLERAEFVRFGQMHRNTFINAPRLLDPTLRFRGREALFFAGQITGVEGYIGSIGAGWLAGVNAARQLLGEALIILPPESMLGALTHYISHAEPDSFQPMKANFGLVPPLGKEYLKGRRKVPKRERYASYAARALEAIRNAYPNDD